MSKHRKHREAATRPEISAHSPTSAEAPAVRPFANQIGWQLLGIIGLSAVLGFAFNSASPVGIRFEAAVASVAADPQITQRLAAQPKASIPTNTPPPVATPKPGSPAPSISIPPKSTTTTPHTHSAPHPSPPEAPPILPVQLNPSPIHWPEAKSLVAAGKAVLLDVRHQPLFNAGHIPGAISLPEMSPAEEFKKFLAQQPTGMVVIVYCSSTSCSQSARVATRFVNEFQWPAVRYMTGGYAEYQQAELVKPAAPPTPKL